MPYVTFSFFQKLKLALKGRRFDIILIKGNCRLHLPSSKQRASANASNSGTIAGLTASSFNGTASKQTAWKRVHAIITGKKIQSGNYLITPCIHTGNYGS
jgi:hypothetical protein